MDNKVISAFATWAFPGVLSFLIMLMYNDIKEMKTDIKALLEQSAGDKVKIEYLEKELESLRDQITYNDLPYDDDQQHKENIPIYAVLPNNKQDGTYTKRVHPTGV